MGVKLDLVNFMAVGVTEGIITEEQAIEMYEAVDNTAKTFEGTPKKLKTIVKHIKSIVKQLIEKGYVL